MVKARFANLVPLVLALGLGLGLSVFSVNAAEPTEPRNEPEQRLLEVLTLTSQGQSAAALEKAQELVRDYPNFQLAQLTLGDLLLARTRPLYTLGNTVVDSDESADALNDLRIESQRRVAAQKAVLPLGAIPQQFLRLSDTMRYAIAVDTSRSRLYLFENSPQGVRLVADYYASVGKLGIEKQIEGDQRTPLGVYFVTSKLQGTSLPPLYGSGALTLNYPNPLDERRGKTGHGIWLHGTPPEQFSRAPQATDGCVALADPDLTFLLETVETRRTPVVIAKELQWVQPSTQDSLRQAFDIVLMRWQEAKSQGDIDGLLSFYAADFRSSKKIDLSTWNTRLRQEITRLNGRELELKERSYLHWSDEDEVMVVTFGEVPRGDVSGPMRRQYWRHNGQSWQIFFESTV